MFMRKSERYTGRGLNLRIDLKEWQDIGELPEFRDSPFLPLKSIPSREKRVDVPIITLDLA